MRARRTESKPVNTSIAIAKEWARPYYLKWLYSHLLRDRYPAQFSDCWRYPTHPLDAGVRQWMESSGELPDVLFLPASDWHTRIQRTQHLATQLAQSGHRCFYLNPHLGREFSSPYLTSPRRLISRLLPRVFELHVHLSREPVYHHRRLTRAEIASVFSALERMLKEAGSRSPVVIVSLPLWNEVAQLLKRRCGCRIIYDCHDLLAGFRNISHDMLEAESDLFALSDFVLFSARWLMDSKNSEYSAVRGKSMLLRNAVRAQDFDFIHRHDRAGRRTVGYAGSLDFWFDVDIIRSAAERRPDWNFMLFGRVEASEIFQLRRLANVRLMGEVPYSTLRYHFAAVDVCVIPFRISPLTLATNPLKLYEYFACGHPVVSSPLPEVQEYEKLVYFASDPEEFLAQLDEAMAENDHRAAVERRLVAERESWTARCVSLGEHLLDSEESPLETPALARQW